ncbi:MAG: exodeoxyribonuclease VII large subunit [Deltaproteobacteria bacterium]|nr:exodeoxyribonuclease VII large subunit [Deltaproteobacteria bacterium]
MGDGRGPESSRERPLGIAEVVRLAGRSLDALGLVWVEGEVTQVSRPTSGHLYFALADRGAVLPAVMWGRDLVRQKFEIVAGLHLRVRGRLGVYERDGKMQLYADFAEPAGAGAEALAREQLKAKLAAEGMFAESKKRPLPKFPRRIGVVTSSRGAAVHDIIRTVHRRFPTPILIADAAVQGPTAPHQIVMGMAMVVRAGVDLVIVGRGGGAATDLSAFDHERVVRTISRCPVPVIAAIGHEVDLTLADLAADARASTPTAAAELAVPDGAAIEEIFIKVRSRLDREIRHRLNRANQDLDHAALALHARGERAISARGSELHRLQHRLAALHPRARLAAKHATFNELSRRLASTHPIARITQGQRALDGLLARCTAAIQRSLANGRSELARTGAQMAALSPLAVLDRGYAVVRSGEAIVRDSAQVVAGDRVHIRLAKGSLVATVEAEGEAK